MKAVFFIAAVFIISLNGFSAPPLRQDLLSDTVLTVKLCNDFTVTGKGDNFQWKIVSWNDLTKLDPDGINYKSQFKIMYSLTGIYVLFKLADSKISSRFTNDFEKIYLGDVAEVFFHPYPTEPLYFEYEVNPLNKELVLLMVNRNNFLRGWSPWAYENEFKVKKKVKITGGKMKPFSKIKSWTAEIFFPYQLFSPFQNTPPESGTIWKANFCRLDYDTGRMVKWAWAPIDTSFHEVNRYHSLIFE